MTTRHRPRLVVRAMVLVVAALVGLGGSIVRGTAPASAADAETTLVGQIAAAVSDFGLPGANTVLSTLGLAGIGGGTLSKEEIQAIVDGAVVDIKDAIAVSENNIIGAINDITLIEAKTCSRYVINLFLYTDALSPDNLQAFATDSYHCFLEITSGIQVNSPNIGEQPTPADGALVNALEEMKAVITPFVEMALIKGGLVGITVNPNRSSLRSATVGARAVTAAPDMPTAVGLIGTIRRDYVLTSQATKRALVPTCGKYVSREGSRIQHERWCQNFSGRQSTRFYTFSVGSDAPDPEPYDYAPLRERVMKNTSWELVDRLMPEYQKPVAGVSCVSVRSAGSPSIQCNADDFNPVPVPTTSTQWERDGTAQPAWSNDQTDVSVACTAGATSQITVQIVNSLGYRGQASQTVTCGDAAMNRPATADSSCAAAQSPGKAIDGAVGTGKWCSAGVNKWWQVDLVSPQAVRQVVIHHAGAGGESGLLNTRDYTLQFSQDGVTWRSMANVRGNTVSVTSHTFPGFASARYVRLTITKPTGTTDTMARIYEVQVLL